MISTRYVFMPSISLMALRRLFPTSFYAQSWYVNEPFANRPCEPGRYLLDDRALAPAVVWAWAYLECLATGEAFGEAARQTGEHDLLGLSIYVKINVDREGIEVHRHLTELPK